MLPTIQFDPQKETPIYRQVYVQIKSAIDSYKLLRGERLPATRELAGLLGLNRTTIAAAYGLLEEEGLIRGHVGRGSFVEGPGRSDEKRQEEKLDWEMLIPAEESSTGTSPASSGAAKISFASSRPSEMLFPLDEFRATCREVIDSAEAAQILQLGSAGGYAPLRRYLLEEARRRGIAGPGDDILITSGCQQAFDLLQRVLASHGETVLLEDPVYPGLRNVFVRGGARVVGVPVGDQGVEIDTLARTIEKEKPRLVVLTPNFQNPTGSTMPETSRLAALEMARRAGVVVVENDLYGDLRYQGEEIPPLKLLDPSGDTIFLSSFSKVAFPGLRVGWAIGPHQFIARLTEAKEASDLHSDQLSQAVLLRFALSGRLAAHRKKMIASGAERLQACLDACGAKLPPGTRFTRPEGGMNVWVKLPEPLDAADLAARAEREGVSFLPGRHFAVSTSHTHRPHTNELRLSFAGLDPRQINTGLSVLGRIFRTELNDALERSGDTHVLV
jgi:2-aminoadipate transaminase